jgi:hypothetical protein
MIFGVIIGLGINYFSDVLPVSRSISRPICQKCGREISAIDYVIYNKCPGCEYRRSIRFIIVLAFTIITSFLLFYFPLANFSFLASFPILVFLGTILVIDFEHRIVLIQTSLFGFVFLFFYGLILHGLSATLLGGFAGFSIMIAFYFLGVVFSKIISKVRHQEIDEVAFGFGDVCIGTILGLLTGWPGILGAIFISMLLFVAFSIIYLILLIILKKYRAFSNTLPFTFFLVLGAVFIFYL